VGDGLEGVEGGEEGEEIEGLFLGCRGGMVGIKGLNEGFKKRGTEIWTERAVESGGESGVEDEKGVGEDGRVADEVGEEGDEDGSDVLTGVGRVQFQDGGEDGGEIGFGETIELTLDLAAEILQHFFVGCGRLAE